MKNIFICLIASLLAGFTLNAAAADAPDLKNGQLKTPWENQDIAGLFWNGKKDEAVSRAKENLEFLVNKKGKKDQQTFDAMMFLSQIFQSNGNFGEAEQICKDALAIWNKDGEENSLTLAFLNNTYAQALKEDKKYDETVEAAKASIRSAEKAIVLGNDNKKAKGFKLISLFLMADSYFKQGKTVEFQETAGKILQLPASDFTWETVDVLSMIARLYAQQKDYENAEKYFAKGKK